MTDTLSAAPASAVRNIILLAMSQAIAGSNQGIVMAVGALAGALIAPNPALATVPTTVMLIGLALTAGPATFIIYALGRRKGFMLGASLAILSGLIAALGIVMGNFWLFSGALFFTGASAAFGQQYRFAVADSVPPDWKARAISFVMLGGVAAGFLGPRLSFIAKDWLGGAEFAGSFLAMAVMAVLSVAILGFTRLAPTYKPQKHENQGRPMRELLRTPDIFVPIISGMVSYALMTFVMVAAPLAMVHVCGLPTAEATTAIQWHIVAMFAPSFITGFIIQRIGGHLTAGIGLALILGCALIALNGTSVLHFDIALILLGFGWNFGFIGSTTLLTSAYRPEEAARVQALNEQLVFGTMAIGSIGSGVLLQLVGWQSINVLVIPFATFAIAVLAYGDYHARSRRASAAQ